MPLHEELLLGAYSGMNEPDGIYGVARSNKVLSRLALSRHQGAWSSVLQIEDVLRREAGPEHETGILEALQHLGCLHLFQTHCQTLPHHLLDLHYEAAWRMGKWDMPPPPPADQSYHAALYTCLKARGEKDEHAFSSSMQRAQEVGPTPPLPLYTTVLNPEP